MIQRVVTSLAAPAAPAQHLRDTLERGGGIWDMANLPFNSQVVCTGLTSTLSSDVLTAFHFARLRGLSEFSQSRDEITVLKYCALAVH